jgi:hypothetical protein
MKSTLRRTANETPLMTGVILPKNLNMRPWRFSLNLTMHVLPNIGNKATTAVLMVAPIGSLVGFFTTSSGTVMGGIRGRMLIKPVLQGNLLVVAVHKRRSR